VRCDNDGRAFRATGVFGSPLSGASGSSSRGTCREEALDALLKPSRSPNPSSPLLFAPDAHACRGFGGCVWRKGSTPRGFLDPASGVVFGLGPFREGLLTGAVERAVLVRDRTAPLGAGLARTLAVEACFFDAGLLLVVDSGLDGLGRGSREILVGRTDGFAEDDGDDKANRDA